MAFPYIFASNFEAGTNAEWDSETDTGSLLDFPHYSTLAQVPLGIAPYRGAYCMRIVMGDTNDHTLIEGDIDIADTVTRYSAFYLLAATNVTATADDTFNIYEVQGTGNAVENAVGLRITAASNLLEIGVGNTAPTAFVTLSRGVWHHVELVSVIQTGGTGTATLWLDGVSVASVSSLTNTAVLRGVLGTQDTLATTTGTLLFDEFKFDDGQLYPDRERFPQNMAITASGHVFVGPGCIDAAALISTTAGNTMTLYDTDTANTNSLQNFVASFDLSAQTSVSLPLRFKRGCYVALAGTNPRGVVVVTQASALPGVAGPITYGSDGMIRRYGQLRKARLGNV